MVEMASEGVFDIRAPVIDEDVVIDSSTSGGTGHGRMRGGCFQVCHCTETYNEHQGININQRWLQSGSQFINMLFINQRWLESGSQFINMLFIDMMVDL
jgi:hypothetical protein